MTTLAAPPTRSRRQAIGLGASALASVGWGFGAIFARLASASGLVLCFYRLWLGAALLSIAVYASGRRLSWSNFRASWLGGVFLAGDMAMFFCAVKLTSVVDVTRHRCRSARPGAHSCASSVRRTDGTMGRLLDPGGHRRRLGRGDRPRSDEPPRAVGRPARRRVHAVLVGLLACVQARQGDSERVGVHRRRDDRGRGHLDADRAGVSAVPRSSAKPATGCGSPCWRSCREAPIS